MSWSYPNTFTYCRLYINLIFWFLFLKEYIVISGKKAQFLTEDGRKKNEYAFNFTNILHNIELKRFIGWTKDEYLLNVRNFFV